MLHRRARARGSSASPYLPRATLYLLIPPCPRPTMRATHQVLTNSPRFVQTSRPRSQSVLSPISPYHPLYSSQLRQRPCHWTQCFPLFRCLWTWECNRRWHHTSWFPTWFSVIMFFDDTTADLFIVEFEALDELFLHLQEVPTVVMSLMTIRQGKINLRRTVAMMVLRKCNDRREGKWDLTI